MDTHTKPGTWTIDIPEEANLGAGEPEPETDPDGPKPVEPDGPEIAAPVVVQPEAGFQAEPGTLFCVISPEALESAPASAPVAPPEAPESSTRELEKPSGPVSRLTLGPIEDAEVPA